MIDCLNKKRVTLICFVRITSILAHSKTKLNQAVKPYSINVVNRRGFKFLTVRFILKMNFFSWLMLRNFGSHLS